MHFKIENVLGYYSLYKLNIAAAHFTLSPFSFLSFFHFLDMLAHSIIPYFGAFLSAEHSCVSGYSSKSLSLHPLLVYTDPDWLCHPGYWRLYDNSSV